MAELSKLGDSTQFMRCTEGDQESAFRVLVKRLGGDVDATREVAEALGLLGGLAARRGRATRKRTKAGTGTTGAIAV
jgi:hypothetical protein